MHKRGSPYYTTFFNGIKFKINQIQWNELIHWTIPYGGDVRKNSHLNPKCWHNFLKNIHLFEVSPGRNSKNFSLPIDCWLWYVNESVLLIQLYRTFHINWAWVGYECTTNHFKIMIQLFTNLQNDQMTPFVNIWHTLLTWLRYDGCALDIKELYWMLLVSVNFKTLNQKTNHSSCR